MKVSTFLLLSGGQEHPFCSGHVIESRALIGLAMGFSRQNSL